MFKIIIKKSGKLYQEVDLQNKTECYVGRGADNDIVLSESYNISRKHIHLKQTPEGQWSVTNLSHSSPLILNGEETTSAQLEVNQSFYVQNYEFVLVKDNAAMVASQMESEESDNSSEEINSEAVPLSTSMAIADSSDQVSSSAEEGGFVASEKSASSMANDSTKSKKAQSEVTSKKQLIVPSTGKTTIMDISNEANQLSAYLKVSAGDDTVQDIFKLDGATEWVIGRDKSCDMIVDSPNMSRKHFKIQNKTGNYFITDLDSSNGTVVNSKELTSKKSYPIQTGDVIYILNIEMIFEIKNLSLAKQLAVMKTPTFTKAHLPAVDNSSTSAPAPYTPAPLPDHIPRVVLETKQDATANSFFKKHKKRIYILGSVVGIVLLLFFSNRDQSTDSTVSSIVIQQGELAGLTPEIQQVVKDAYQAASELLLKDKFAYCLSELKKVHKYTEFYKDSKKLKEVCTESARNRRIQKNRAEQEKKAKETDQRIQTITDNCSKKFDTFQYKHELDECLKEATHLSSADQRVHSLILRFNFKQKRKEEEKKAQQKRQAHISKIRKKYTYAKKLHSKGKIETAMSAYQNFINKTGSYKELVLDKRKAKRELASIKKKYNNDINRLNSRCNQLFKEGKFQSAFYECEKASQKIPESRNKVTLQIMEDAKLKLQVSMKPIYEEAALYESTGNIITAKEKWKEILSKDIKAGLYYQRAKIKLDKY